MTLQPQPAVTQRKDKMLLNLPSLPTVIGGMIASAAVFITWRIIDPAMAVSRQGEIVWPSALMLLAFSVSAFFGLQGYGKWLSEHRQRSDQSQEVWLSSLERLIVITSWGQLALVVLVILLLGGLSYTPSSEGAG